MNFRLSDRWEPLTSHQSWLTCQETVSLPRSINTLELHSGTLLAFPAFSPGNGSGTCRAWTSLAALVSGKPSTGHREQPQHPLVPHTSVSHTSSGPALGNLLTSLVASPAHETKDCCPLVCRTPLPDPQQTAAPAGPRAGFCVVPLPSLPTSGLCLANFILPTHCYSPWKCHVQAQTSK